jgi:hypothetical protein
MEHSHTSGGYVKDPDAGRSTAGLSILICQLERLTSGEIIKFISSIRCIDNKITFNPASYCIMKLFLLYMPQVSHFGVCLWSG